MWARLLLIILLGGVFRATAGEGTPQSLNFAAIADVPSTTVALDLLDAAYGELGVTINARTVPSRRALLMANIGALDGDLFRIAGVAEQYPNLVRVPHPLLYGELHAVTRGPLLTGAKSLEHVKTTHLRVAVRRGVIIAEQSAEALGMIPVRADSYEQMRALLEWNRVDLALVSYVEGISPLNTEAWQTFYTVPEPITEFTLYHYLHRRHAHLVNPLAAALKQLERSGERARIIRRTKRAISGLDLIPTY